jgi:hypothetical protein
MSSYVDESLHQLYESIQQNKIYYTGYFFSLVLLVFAGIFYFVSSGSERNNMLVQLYFTSIFVFMVTVLLFDVIPSMKTSYIVGGIVFACFTAMSTPVLMTAITTAINLKKVNAVPTDSNILSKYVLAISIISVIPFLLYLVLANKTQTNVNGVLRRFGDITKLPTALTATFAIICLLNFIAPFKYHEQVTYKLTEGFK